MRGWPCSPHGVAVKPGADPLTRLSDTYQAHRALVRAGLILTTAVVTLAALPAWAQAPVDPEQELVDPVSEPLDRSRALADAAPEQADRGRVLADRARTLAEDGRCDEASGDLAAARADSPDDASVALLQGQCLIATGDFVGASQVLAEAKQLDPQLPDVDLYHGVALYHMGDYANAWASLQAAKGNVTPVGMPDYELYTGLLQLERGEFREGALALERARAIDPDQVDPVASFYAGVAWQSLGEHQLARDNLRRTIDIDGKDGLWGKRAAELLRGESIGDRAFFGASLGIEYDSNVTLRSQAVVLPDAISDESDGRIVWSAYGGAELFRSNGWSGGIAASYSGNAHFHLEQFNTHYPVGTVWLDRDLTTYSFLRARYDIGYAWLDFDPYVLTQTGALEWHRNWGKWGNTEVAALWEWYEFLFNVDLLSPDPVQARERDRSGTGVGGALRHRIDLPGLRNDVIRRFELNGSYTYRRYWAKGEDWDYNLHELRLGFDSLWPWKIEFDVWGSAGFNPFDNVSTYSPAGFGDRRKDFIGQVHSEIERPIYDWLSVSGRYWYIRNESNVEVFDYSRHVVGAFVNVDF